MRFGKRNKSPLSWGWRAKREDESEPQFRPVASEERNALLSSGDVASPPTPPSGRPRATDDPAQSALIHLQRFQQIVMDAQRGYIPDDFAEGCMEELIGALEITYAQGWHDVTQALTETGRVLKSYDEAYRASECTPFLTESYQMLCLMVTHQMGGGVRPWVLQKWRNHFQTAVTDLTNAGLALVDDESDEDYEEEPAQPVIVADEAAPDSGDSMPFDLPPDAAEDFSDTVQPELPDLEVLLAESDAELEESPADIEDSAQTRVQEDPPPPAAQQLRPEPEGRGKIVASDELPPLTPLRMRGDEAAEPVVASAGYNDPVEVGPFSEAPAIAGLPEDGLFGTDNGVVGPVEAPSPVMHGEAPAPGVAPASATPAAPEPESGDSDDEIAAMLDELSDELEQITRKAAGDASTIYTSAAQKLLHLAERAAEKDWQGSISVCQALARLCQQGMDAEIQPDDRFIDLAYGFAGAYIEGRDGARLPGVREWMAECESLLSAWTSTPEKAPVAKIEPPSNAAVSLLETAQRAAVGGNPAEATLLALQAAATFARSQAEATSRLVQETEARLQQSAGEIEQARETVQQAEQQVITAEDAISAAERAYAEQQGRTGDQRRNVDRIRARIADLDEQIRQLQAQREEAAREEAGASTELAGQEQREREAQLLLDGKADAEQASRVALEDARQQVKNLQRRRGEIESEMERAREMLTRQRASLEDIEETIAQIRDGGRSSAGDEMDSETLF